MKIAINLTREKVGGITSSNINLINYLYKLNYEFTGIELSSRMHMEGTALFRYFAPDIFDHHIIGMHHLPLEKTLRRANSLAEFRKTYREPIKILRQILRESKPDVVLLNGTYYFPWLISVAAKKEKIPVVLWYAGVLTKEMEHKSARVRRMFLWVEKEIINNASKIIFPSELCKKMAEDLVTKRKIKKGKGVVIPNPMAPVFTDPAAYEPSGERNLAAVGRYSKIKNFNKFFELHVELQKRQWRHNSTFVTNPDALKHFYLQQSLVVCPSTFETFGNVPMEAACLGVPVLVNDTMGCAEILKKVGLGNMVISFSDMAKVADRAQELCGKPIDPKIINELKKMLDTNVVSEEIRQVIDEAAKKPDKTV